MNKLFLERNCILKSAYAKRERGNKKNRKKWIVTRKNKIRKVIIKLRYEKVTNIKVIFEIIIYIYNNFKMI